MRTIDRRNFLHRSAAAGIGASGLSLLMVNAANAERAGRRNTPIEAPDNGGYGELQPDPAGVLALPAGFGYVRFGETGTIMSDGIPTPGSHDGMAAFPGPGSHVRLVRNHERNTGAPFATPAYDPLAAGGTTTSSTTRRARSLCATPSTAQRAACARMGRLRRVCKSWRRTAGR